MEEQLIKLVNKMARDMGIKREVNVLVKDYKSRMAFVSLDTSTIRINRKIIQDEEKLKQVLRHELLHIKTQSKFHGPEFFDGIS